MQTHTPASPFGPRPLSLAAVNGQRTARTCPPDAVVDKWRVFRAVCEARSMLGATERALAVLSALISFHPDTELSGEGALVFPSNAQLSLRAHGMAPATLRRHLAVLVECGLIVRRDSPNGKRFARKGQGGAIEQAFGFDLTPLVARAAEFERLADAVRAERRTLHLLRERLTICRRDICKMIELGQDEGMRGDWQAYRERYRILAVRIPRTATAAQLEPLAEAFAQLADEIRNILERHVKSQNTSANESQTERHKQNSNPNLYLESEPRSEKEQGAATPPTEQAERLPQQPQDRQTSAYPLSLVLRACPDIVDYARNGISDWAGLVATADLARAALGISPDAWRQACEVMGPADAAIVVAAILQRADAISSAGGYLRSLTEKARAGQFSIGPVLMALLRARDKALPRTG
ncbi:plasmid replication protein RepC [Arvimicrobium flavum]|uniref:plasmid replication protein RepC n=1 Tax=Arvimicrobium flavum TaxID=3393320 RepID=UPI00237AF32C|nr:plasmid replication protein RepC [Mesorhizobium shangrilense]